MNIHRRIVQLVLVAALAAASGGAWTAPAGAADEPSAIPFTAWLPPLHDSTYEPTSEDDCRNGSFNCVNKVIREMEKRFEPLGVVCNHNALFSLMYLRTTEAYLAAALEPGFFQDPKFVNHQDVVFARLYFEAFDAYYGGNRAASPVAWRIAFETADAKSVSGMGDMFLGMNAHVNRDLPYVLEAIGLVKPDGTSRKTDHDKVNQFLVTVIDELFAEAAARFDPTVDDSQVEGTTYDETGGVALLQSWRERAWRNAERLAAATTSWQRAAVERDIENGAALEAQLLVAAYAYSDEQAVAALSSASAINSSTGLLSPLAFQAQAAAATAIREAYRTGQPGKTLADREAFCAANHG